MSHTAYRGASVVSIIVIAILSFSCRSVDERRALKRAAEKRVESFDSRGDANDFLRLSLEDENKFIPPDGITHAWARIRQMQATQKAGVSTTSWTSLGPGNVGGRTISMIIDPNNPSTMLV
ncbi:MAG TPA: hypothetical protein VHL58_13250, partial [Thermoanaerobaculia bacterium]|nr:hypothetical protein [Thermoanaerobaculia bacterium]